MAQVTLKPWFWFCQRFLPVKKEFFLSTVTLCMLRMGNWIEEKFQCNLLVSLAKLLFILSGFLWFGPIQNLINWDWLEYDCIAIVWIIIGLNSVVSLKCLKMTFVGIWRFVRKNCWIELNVLCTTFNCNQGLCKTAECSLKPLLRFLTNVLNVLNAVHEQHLLQLYWIDTYKHVHLHLKMLVLNTYLLLPLAIITHI